MACTPLGFFTGIILFNNHSSYVLLNIVKFFILERILTALACSYPYYLFHRKNKYLAIPDFTCPSAVHNSIYYLCYHIIRDYYLNLYLWQKINYILCTSVELCMSLLPSEPFDFCNSESLNTYFF